MKKYGYTRKYYVTLCGALFMCYVTIWADSKDTAYRIAVKNYDRDNIGSVYTPLMWSRKYTQHLRYLGEVA